MVPGIPLSLPCFWDDLEELSVVGFKCEAPGGSAEAGCAAAPGALHLTQLSLMSAWVDGT